MCNDPFPPLFVTALLANHRVHRATMWLTPVALFNNNHLICRHSSHQQPSRSVQPSAPPVRHPVQPSGAAVHGQQFVPVTLHRWRHRLTMWTRPTNGHSPIAARIIPATVPGGLQCQCHQRRQLMTHLLLTRSDTRYEFPDDEPDARCAYPSPVWQPPNLAPPGR
jgi:hypothetical protein